MEKKDLNKYSISHRDYKYLTTSHSLERRRVYKELLGGLCFVAVLVVLILFFIIVTV